MNAVSEHKDGAVLHVRVVPRASRDEVCGETGGALRVRLKAAPVDGKANEALMRYLGKTLRVSRRDVVLLSGRQNRNKRILIAGVTREDVEKALARLHPRSTCPPKSVG